MSEKVSSSSSVAAVPDESHQVLLVDGTDVQTKVGHVAKFQSVPEKGDDIDLDDLKGYKLAKPSDEFVGLTTEDLKVYINSPKWKRIRWIIALVYLTLIALLLAGSIYLVLTSPRCPPKPRLDWYQRDVIYEIDLPTFFDADNDGIGDLTGLMKKLPYLEKNRMKSILLQSSIFNSTLGTSIQLDGTDPATKKLDLLTLDPQVGTDDQLQELLKRLNRKDMRLMIDLPLSSTFDPNGYSWYGSSTPMTNQVKNPCINGEKNLACQYYRGYGRLPLDFNQNSIVTEANNRLRHWLGTKKFDGVRVDIPLQYNNTAQSYEISYSTIEQWQMLQKEIEKSSKAKLLLFDIPVSFQDLVKSDVLLNLTAHPLFISTNSTRKTRLTADHLDERLKFFETNDLAKPKFWKLSSKRTSDELVHLTENQLPKEMAMTLIMLLGGTPVLLHGDELGLDQKTSSLMPWESDGTYNGFTKCSSADCTRLLSRYNLNANRTSVKRQEAFGGSKESMLKFYRRLAELRQKESFQFGLLETGTDETSNIFWFIREAPGHRGYVVVFNLGQAETEAAHISLYRLTEGHVPSHVHYEYQWPQVHLPTSNTTHIDSDNLLISPQSISIFWWKEKLIQPNILFAKAKEHHDHH